LKLYARESKLDAEVFAAFSAARASAARCCAHLRIALDRSAA
jgi:hypothetical protein